VLLGKLRHYQTVKQSTSSGVTRGLSQGEKLAEGSPHTKVAGPLANAHKKVEK